MGVQLERTLKCLDHQFVSLVIILQWKRFSNGVPRSDLHGWWSVCKPSMMIYILWFTDCTEKDTSKEEEQKSLKILLPHAKPEYRKQYWTQNCGSTCHYSFSNSHVVCTSAPAPYRNIIIMKSSACETDVCKRVGLVIIWGILSSKFHSEHCTVLQLMSWVQQDKPPVMIR